ncbi:MAG: nucleotidyltransferase domain-containing protein [Deltaproteobacteria bacterium]|nr:nucleotidyltransferase domain-containing protein [Deltaproteobacteria bacterium]
MVLAEAARAAVLDAPEVRSRHVTAIWLFGSRARGDAGPTSDVDLAILCDPPLGLDRTVVMDRASRAISTAVDLVDLGSAPPELVWEVVTTGRLILEEDELAVERFVRRARHAAEDAEQRHRMILLAQVGHVGKLAP